MTPSTTMRRDLLQRSAQTISATALAIFCGNALPLLSAQAAETAVPKRRGSLPYANSDTPKPLVDPATVDALGPSDCVRGVAEFLTRVDGRNIRRPYLLESLELRYPASPEFIGTACQVYAQQLQAIGVTLQLVPMPPDAYWAKWTEWTFAAPFWGHRPLATMLMGLALRTGAAWNETGYADPGFQALLTEATGTIDVEARRKVYERLQPYLREHGPFAEPLFVFALAGWNETVKNFSYTAFNYGIFTDIWLA